MRDDEDGSAPVEFVLVGTLLTVLTLGVLQFALAVYVRNVVHDAAVEGAYHGALADTEPAAGAERAERLVAIATGGLPAHARAVQSTVHGEPIVEVTVVATLPLIGLFGIPDALEVTGHAPSQSLD